VVDEEVRQLQKPVAVVVVGMVLLVDSGNNLDAGVLRVPRSSQEWAFHVVAVVAVAADDGVREAGTDIDTDDVVRAHARPMHCRSSAAS